MNTEDIIDDREMVIPGEAMSPEQTLWLRRSAELFKDSTDYYQSSIFDAWRANIANFRNEHAPGSKYTTEAYRTRSKLFRPKTRTAVRMLEATAATALFTNDDLLTVTGQDPNNKDQAEAAKLHKALLQFRLETSIPWFLTVLGAYQDTHVYGVCISRQGWDLRKLKRKEVIPAMDEFDQPIRGEDGVMLGYEEESEELVADKPEVVLIAPENFRFDPAAEWTDVIGTSPYLMELMPMYAGEVMAMSANGWKELPLERIVVHGNSGLTDATETVRDAREGRNRQDATEVASASEYSVVWVRFNIIRDENGEDFAFYTLGDFLLLTDPTPLKKLDPLGRSRYTMGFSGIEAHRTLPTGTIELNRPLTEMLNDVTNQRMDNVRLVLNKRYALRREANIDLGALMRNTPGGGVMMDDVDKDYRIMETPDVTQSSYLEQDRLAVESDELLGTFSQASVQNNRVLNETVGGMNLMASGANKVQELALRIFIETWVEPVLMALVKLESLYETDETILALAAGKAELATAIDDRLMLQNLVVKVNVGMGNTDPTQKLERFLKPLETVAQFPEFIAELDFQEIGKEVFALSGMGDGSRFMLSPEKRQERAQAAGQEAPDPRIAVEEMRQQGRQMELEMKQMQLEQDGILRQLEIESTKEVAMAKLALDKEIKLNELYSKLGLTRESLAVKAKLEQLRDQTTRDIAALRAKNDALKARLQSDNLAQGYDTF